MEGRGKAEVVRCAGVQGVGLERVEVFRKSEDRRQDIIRGTKSASIC